MSQFKCALEGSIKRDFVDLINLFQRQNISIDSVQKQTNIAFILKTYIKLHYIYIYISIDGNRKGWILGISLTWSLKTTGAARGKTVGTLNCW